MRLAGIILSLGLVSSVLSCPAQDGKLVELESIVRELAALQPTTTTYSQYQSLLAQVTAVLSQEFSHLSDPTLRTKTLVLGLVVQHLRLRKPVHLVLKPLI